MVLVVVALVGVVFMLVALVDVVDVGCCHTSSLQNNLTPTFDSADTSLSIQSGRTCDKPVKRSTTVRANVGYCSHHHLIFPLTKGTMSVLSPMH